MPGEIRFYKATDSRGNPLPYGYLSNFASYGFELFGIYFKSVEHFYQASKYVAGSKEWREIVDTLTASEAFRLGKDARKFNLIREDWKYVKDDVMLEGVTRKFEVNLDIRSQLLSTDDWILIEDSPTDTYWGIGAMGQGLNKLGEIEMRVRSHFQTKLDMDRMKL